MERAARLRYSRTWQRRRDEAREQLRAMEQVVEGWVLIGADWEYRVARGAVEHEFTMGLKPAFVRLWRDFPDRPDLEGEARALHFKDYYERDLVLGTNMAYEVWNIDNPLCPVALDWCHLLRERRLLHPRIVRGRHDRFRFLNIPFTVRGEWADLAF